MKIAVIDVGFNSLKMVKYKVEPDGTSKSYGQLGVLAKLGYRFDVVVTSPIRRAKETANLIGEAINAKTRVEEWAELSPEGSRSAFYRRLSGIRPGSKVLCVGHEPYLTIVMGEIAGRGEEDSGGFRISLKKGGLAKLLVMGFNPEITGELRWLLTPKQIRRMA